MKSFLSLALFVWLAPAAFGKEPPKPMVTGLKNPESVCVGPGRIARSSSPPSASSTRTATARSWSSNRAARPSPFVTGLDDPKGIAVLPEVALRHRQDEGAAHRRDRQGRQGRGVRGRGEVPGRRRCSSTTSPSIPRTASIYVSDSGKDGNGRGGLPASIPKGGLGVAGRRRQEAAGAAHAQRPDERRHVVPARRRLRHRRSCTA